jgi:hypothetical protein
MKKIWYGYSPEQSRILFFDNETTANNASLESTGNFTVDNSGVISGLNVEANETAETVG